MILQYIDKSEINNTKTQNSRFREKAGAGAHGVSTPLCKQREANFFLLRVSASRIDREGIRVIHSLPHKFYKISMKLSEHRQRRETKEMRKKAESAARRTEKKQKKIEEKE